MSCGFVFALRFPGRVGDTLLVCAAASAVLGELVSTYALKNLLTQLGEATPPRAEAASARPSRRRPRTRALRCTSLDPAGSAVERREELT